MKKFIFCFFILFCFGKNNNLFGQECKVKKDPSTGKKIVLWEYTNKDIVYEYEKGQIKFNFVFVYRGRFTNTVESGTKLVLKFEGGETMILKTVSAAKPIEKPVSLPDGSNLITSNYTYEFNLSKEQLTKLASSKVVFLQYPDASHFGKFLDFEMTSKSSKKTSLALQEGGSCILKNL